MARPLSVVLVTLLLVGCAHREEGPPAARATKPARHSTPDERQRFLTLVHQVQASPPRGYDPDVEWAIGWLVEVDDVSVTICADVLGSVMKEGEKPGFNPAIIGLLSAGAFVMEHPELATNEGEVNFAALTALLDVYAAERKRDGPASAPYDELLARARAGTLRAQVIDQVRRCKDKK